MKEGTAKQNSEGDTRYRLVSIDPPQSVEIKIYTEAKLQITMYHWPLGVAHDKAKH